MMGRPFVLSRRKASIHRADQNKYLREMCGPLVPSSVLNLGARPTDADKEGSTYASYFPGARFQALDQRPHDHPDYIEADLMDAALDIGTFDLVLCMSVIEHIDKPWEAAPIISSLVAPGGHLYIAMPWFYPTHEGPDFGDHWRARPSGVKVLFEDLECVAEAYFESPLVAVKDRRRYWKNLEGHAAGSSILFKKSSA